MFIGRKKEIKRIEKRLQLDSLQAVLIYGRRRTGKTELADEAIRRSGKRSFSYLCRKITSREQINEFGDKAAIFMGIDGFHPNNAEELFRALFTYSIDNPFILFIDEYPYFRGDNAELDSTLQRVMHDFEGKAKLTLILCGSYMGIMKKMIERNSPLYGRFNEIIHLHTFDYFDSSKFYDNLSNEDKFKYYACFGGTAFNIKNLDYSQTFEENLLENFIELDSFFDKEALSVVSSELIKEENANTLFEMICKGKRNYVDLNLALGDPSKDNATRYLKSLEEMDLISKSYAVNANSSRKALYYISDNFLDFYFTFLSRHQMERRIMSPKQFYEMYVKEKLEKEYLPRKFEEVVKEYCIRANMAMKLPFLAISLGRLYYHSKGIDREFDLILKTNDKLVPIECKYSKNPISVATINEEKEQWRDLPFEIEMFGFASRNGFTDEVKENKNLLLIDFNDIYSPSLGDID